eukprot:Skav223923  [mRNA]  locus=scaffold2593:344072:357285:+ [translate_table: standard]
MDFPSCVSVAAGVRVSVVVRVTETIDDLHLGREDPSGVKVAFRHVGVIGDIVTLYNVTRSGSMHGEHWVLLLDHLLPPLGHHPLKPTDFMYAHDTCCGLGGFSTACEALGIKVISAVDLSALAVESYQLNHSSSVWQADVANMESRYRMHSLQLQDSCQALVTAGFPCQPYSRQGQGLGLLDSRSRALPDLLITSHLLQSVGLLLECVPEAGQDTDTQTLLESYAQQRGMKIVQTVLHLHTVWPARRTRWFALIVPHDMPLHVLQGLPCLSTPPTVGAWMSPEWPAWDESEEQHLQWTEMELQVYRDPTYGEVDRRLNMQEPLPTALHSWGNALYACPCKCRTRGLSPITLRKKGLRGIEIRSKLWPYFARHIHPKELQYLLGFPPMELTLKEGRAQLCLFGNAVSPLQVVWILSQLLFAMFPGFVLAPLQVLQAFMEELATQKQLVWPNMHAGVGTLSLDFQDTTCEVAFHPHQTVGQLLKAEWALTKPGRVVRLCAAGRLIPPTAFLQECSYQVMLMEDDQGTDSAHVPVLLVHLGVVQLFWVPQHMSYRSFVHWAGIREFRELVDETARLIDPQDEVSAWRHVTVRLCLPSLELDLALFEEGFGLGPLSGIQIISPDTWICTGLWSQDEYVRARLLVTCIGLETSKVVVWLPSFAAAVLEARISVPFGKTSVTAAHLVSRAAQASGLVAQDPTWTWFSSLDSQGSFSEVLHQLELDLGMPSYLASALASVCRSRSEVSDDSDVEISPTWPMPSCSEQTQWPVAPHGLIPNTEFRGLSAMFIRQVASALLGGHAHLLGFHTKVLVVSHCPDASYHAQPLDFWDGSKPLLLFTLLNRHWTLVKCEFADGILSVTIYDGLAHASLSAFDWLVSTWKRNLQCTKVSVHSTWIFAQTRAHTCGTLALAHFAFLAGFVSREQAFQMESMHEGLAVISQQFSCPFVGCGADEQALIETLSPILQAKGVPSSEVVGRIQSAIKALGHPQLKKALDAHNPWAALKQLGSQKAKPFQWVTYGELQEHIKERSATHFGADADVKKRKKTKEPRKPPVAAASIDPAALELPKGVFVTNDGQALPQLKLEQVVCNARGVAFGSPSQVQQFLVDGKFISVEGLTILVVGSLPESYPRSLPLHVLRVPAIYKATDEPIILECTSVQLGDQAVYQRTNQMAPEIQSFPTGVFRAHIFEDLWQHEGNWAEFVAHPIRSLVQAFDLLQMCRDKDCDGCSRYHPSCEEEGIESALIDVWGFSWHMHDGAKAPPQKAQVLSVYLRVPESSCNSLHRLSGTYGVFFEPRSKDQPTPDPAYGVVWVPKASFADITHRAKTIDNCVAICRLGVKYGIRCLVRHQEDLHSALCPSKPYVQCAIKVIYRLEPLPVGTQRQSLVDLLKDANWNARPLHQCPGSQGKAWTVGSDQDPPHPFIEAQHGWISISKVRDQQPKTRPQDLIATARTKKHIKDQSSSSTGSDPWQSGSDPWGQFVRTTPAPVVPSQHVQSKLEDVELRLQEQLDTKFTSQVKQVEKESQDRITVVENQLLHLVENQQKLETWIQDGSARTQELRQDCSNLHQAVVQVTSQMQEQGKNLQALNHEVASQGQAVQHIARDVSGIQEGLKGTLDAYFAKQTEHLEDLFGESRTKSGSTFGFSRLWTFFVFLLCFVSRVGEAAVPGPSEDFSASFEDPPSWSLPGVPEFCLGVGNPSGIFNKRHCLGFFPKGYWHLAETQASKYQQCAVQSSLRKVSADSNRHLRSVMGAPAPLRSGSQASGAWTGVMCWGDCPLRSIPCLWPSGEYVSGRAMLVSAHIGALTVTTATVYCPPRGPTYPNAVALGESLLTPVTEALVLGRSGPRAILGDFNCPAGSLQQMQIWKAHGWIELQELMFQLHGIQPKMTCKGATAPDQLWASPELAALISNVAVWDVFPDHAVLIAGLNVQSSPRFELQWRLPGHIPWEQVDTSLWTSSGSFGPFRPSTDLPVGGDHVDNGFSSTEAFRRWSSSFESQVSACIPAPSQRGDRSFYGRGKLDRPQPRLVNPVVPKHSRPGEINQVSGFLNRATARWFKQARRIQSYVHAVSSSRVAENFLSRAALWHSIMAAHGFVQGFVTWWTNRPIKLQGAPDVLPTYPPSLELAKLIQEDFMRNYRAFESWQAQRRTASCRAKLESSTRGLFSVTSKAAKPPLDVLLDQQVQPISVHDTVNNVVSVPLPFDAPSITYWTLQDQPALVAPVQGSDLRFTVDSDLVLATGQSLCAHSVVHEVSEIHDRLQALWSPRWNKHAAVTYCQQLRNSVLTDRIQQVHPFFQKLRRTKLPLGTKKMNIRQVLWPRALHGCEAVFLGDHHLSKLRSGVMKALHWDRAGASPVARISLFNEDLDPAWYQVWKVAMQFRHQCATNRIVYDWWTLYASGDSGKQTNGPFGKLQRLLQDYDLHLDGDYRLWFSDNGWIHFLLSAERDLRRVLLRSFHTRFAQTLSGRAGYGSLDSFSKAVTTSHDAAFSPIELEQLMIVRDGSFYTQAFQRKWDSTLTGMCESCGVPDTKLHRFTACSRYDDLRRKYLELFEEWDTFPECFQHQGLVPGNPWELLVWEALIALPNTVDDFMFAPSGTTWHVFTDGTTSDPQDESESLAAYAVHVEGKGSVACGWLPGLNQTILRAEVTAVLSATLWASHLEGALHLWCDNQQVVDQYRAIQQGTADINEFEHADLWRKISELIQNARAELVIHKVASHSSPEDSASPLEDWCREENAKVDFQARLTNRTRPRYFEKIWRRYIGWKRRWECKVRDYAKLAVEIAGRDCAPVEASDQDPVDEDSHAAQVEFVFQDNTAEVSVQLQVLQEDANPFSQMGNLSGVVEQHQPLGNSGQALSVLVFFLGIGSVLFSSDLPALAHQPMGDPWGPKIQMDPDVISVVYHVEKFYCPAASHRLWRVGLEPAWVPQLQWGVKPEEGRWIQWRPPYLVVPYGTRDIHYGNLGLVQHGSTTLQGDLPWLHYPRGPRCFTSTGAFWILHIPGPPVVPPQDQGAFNATELVTYKEELRPNKRLGGWLVGWLVGCFIGWMVGVG